MADLKRDVTTFVQLPATHMVFAGMSLGYADESAAINSFRTEREPLENFVHMHGF